jgi:4-amino-4-deoxy-L-arabinose transferase-like glycosyltransferase
MMALVSAPYFMALGGVVTLDMGLTAWTTSRFCAFVLAEQRARSASAQPLAPRRVGRDGARGAFQGPHRHRVPGRRAFFYMVVRRDFRPLLRLEWGYGLLVFLAIAAPWFVAVSLENAEFAHFFFVHEHFERFLTTTHRRTEPWWYFLPILVGGFLPWMLALPAALAHAIGARGADLGAAPAHLRARVERLHRALLQRLGIEASGLHPPAFPPLALVLGAISPRRSRGASRSRSSRDPRRRACSPTSPGARLSSRKSRGHASST